MTSGAEVDGEVPPGVKCSRCGGAVRSRPGAARNPFLPRPPIHLVCADCGLEFDIDQPELPPSGKMPWE